MTENNIPPAPLLLPEPGMGRKLFKQLLIIGTATVIIIAGVIFIFFKSQSHENKTPAPSVIIKPTTPMIIASEAFKNNDYIPGKYTCDGLNVNPPLRFADIPEGTVSLALIVDDPDSPSGVWTHWLVWNVTPDTSSIAENSIPAGSSSGRTTFGESKYGGPCPGSGTHHYEFKLYALDTRLNLPPSASKTELETAMQGHVIIDAKLTGLYSRGN